MPLLFNSFFLTCFLNSFITRLRRPQHNDVIVQVAALGIGRRPLRGCRAGRRHNKTSAINNTAIGNSVTSCRVDRLSSRSTASHQLITPTTSAVECKRWKLPSFLLTNIRSLMNKMDDFEAVVHHNDRDIACVTETWLSDEVPSETVSMNGFHIFRKDRSRQGEVMPAM